MEILKRTIATTTETITELNAKEPGSAHRSHIVKVGMLSERPFIRLFGKDVIKKL